MGEKDVFSFLGFFSHISISICLALSLMDAVQFYVLWEVNIRVLSIITV